MRTINDKVKDWLADFTLDEILEQCDLDKQDLLVLLYKGGHIALPDWLEDELEEYDETEDWDELQS